VTARHVLSGAALAVVLGALSAHGAVLASEKAAPATTSERDASLDEYRQHLTELSAVVAACAKARDTKTCDPELVGPDDHIPFGDGRRLIRFAWLRALLAEAQVREEAETKPAKEKDVKAGEEPARPMATELLREAQTRLAADLAASKETAPPATNHEQQRAAMRQVLAESAFRHLNERGVRDVLLEKLGNWLNRIFAGASRMRARSAWIGRLIVWGFIVLVLAGLAWALLQLERRWRVRLVPEMDRPAPGAASARDWQLWLADARRAAEGGRWREAIHFAYWAAISRLESRRLWPADRARTPRAYLALVSEEDPRRTSLARLTASFERFWYGGRASAESDYRQAEELAAGLMGTSGGAGASRP